MTSQTGANSPYVLGHAEHELDRLRAQARFLEPVTRQFFREAGIRPGMRVPDVGSRPGEVPLSPGQIRRTAGTVGGSGSAPPPVTPAPPTRR